MCEAVACFSLGVLLSFAPKIENSLKGKQKILFNIIGTFITLALSALLIPIALHGSLYNKVLYYCVIYFLFVPLIYLQSNIPFKNKYVNVLGMLSVPIYIYQELSWFLSEQHLITNNVIIYWIPFVIAFIEVFFILILKKINNSQENKNV